MLDHKLVLEMCDTDPSHLIGCDAAIMVCLRDITLLDNWKQDMSKARALSLVELATRGQRCTDHRQSINVLKRSLWF